MGEWHKYWIRERVLSCYSPWALKGSISYKHCKKCEPSDGSWKEEKCEGIYFKD